MEHIEYGRPPGLYRGLDMAEASQLSLDYAASPEAFEAVRLFCGKYVDERAQLAVELVKHQEIVDHVNANQSAYFEVFDTVGLRRNNNMFRDLDIKAQPEAVINVAHGAAGAYMLDLKHAASESLAEFLDNADGLSVLLAEFCQERLDGEQLLIMGQQFDYKLGFLTSLVPDNVLDRGCMHQVYGTHKRFIALRQELAKTLTPKQTEDTIYSHANIDDWARLLVNLDALAQF